MTIGGLAGKRRANVWLADADSGSWLARALASQDVAGAAAGLKARLSGHALTIDGAAAVPAGPYNLPRIYVVIDPISVTNNDDPATAVTVSGQLAGALARVDISGMTNAAGYVVGTVHADFTAIGSSFGDVLQFYGTNKVEAHGKGGDDILLMPDGNDKLYGEAGNDTLAGYGGNDQLLGGSGDDVLNGGDGKDSVVYSGNRSDYRIEIFEGCYRVTDLRAGSPDGIDLVGNVEQLRFADSTKTLDTHLTDVHANVEGDVLTLTGHAARASYRISIEITPSSITIHDNNATAEPVSAHGTADYPIRTIDLSGLDANANPSISDYTAGVAHKLVGSDGWEYVNLYNSGDDILRGKGGEDVFYAYSGDDQLYGGDDNDYMYGGDGHDQLTGGPGNDVLDGGADGDTVFYTGNAADYQVSVVNGQYQIVDLRTGSPEGTDLVANVEHAQFADQLVTLPSIG